MAATAILHSHPPLLHVHLTCVSVPMSSLSFFHCIYFLLWTIIVPQILFMVDGTLNIPTLVPGRPIVRARTSASRPHCHTSLRYSTIFNPPLPSFFLILIFFYKFYRIASSEQPSLFLQGVMEPAP